MGSYGRVVSCYEIRKAIVFATVHRKEKIELGWDVVPELFFR
jgi:hypothetical protein